jgi:hypothetical protein
MATKKKAKRGKKVKKGGFFKEKGGLFNKNSDESVNPTKKFIQSATDDEAIELTEKGKSHFETLKKQKSIESMEPPILLDELLNNFEVIKLNNTLFLEMENNEKIYEDIKYYFKNNENIWIFFEDKAMMLDYALMEELSFEYNSKNILKYPPTIHDNKVFFVANKEIHIYDLTEEAWSAHSISGEITSSIIIDDELIFLVTDFTKLLCLNENFKEEWSFITEGYLLNTPILNDFLYITSSDGMLYKLDKEGDIIWSFNSKSPIETSPTLTENAIVINSMSGKLFFVSQEDKKELTTIDLGFHLLNKPIIKNGFLYAFNRRFIYKIDLTSYSIQDIVMLETTIESISSLDDYLQIKINTSQTLIVDDSFTNINITNFKTIGTSIQHINFLISMDYFYKELFFLSIVWEMKFYLIMKSCLTFLGRSVIMYNYNNFLKLSIKML